MSKYFKNEVVEGCVTGIEKYGIFVTLDEYYSGLIHISEISDNFVRDINKFVNIPNAEERIVQLYTELEQIELDAVCLDKYAK